MMMLLLPMAAMAQKDDFGLDFTVEAQKKRLRRRRSSPR